MKTYDLYGLTCDNLETARIVIEQLLGTRMVKHESSYVGEYYKLEVDQEENMELRANFDPLDGESAELDYPEVPVLLYVNGTQRPQVYEQLLAVGFRGIRLLRRDVLD